MAAPPLLIEQCELLGALLDPDASPVDRTTERLATRVGMGPPQVAARLQELASRSPPLVRRGYDEEWQVNAWLATDAGREAHDEVCGA
jgi:hypothetical protein